jgi:hypothetical protein
VILFHDLLSLSMSRSSSQYGVRCDKCKVSICVQCVTGKHNGHKMSNMKEVISSLRTTFREEMHTKLDVIKANGGRIVISGLLYFLFPFFDRFCILQLLLAIRQHLRE